MIRTTLRPARLLLLLIGAAAIAAAACGGGDDTPQALTLNIKVDPATLDPAQGVATESRSVERQLFRGLLRFDQDLALIPDAAEAVPSQADGSISADGLTYIFDLHDDAEWSDGRDLRAGDFAFAVGVQNSIRAMNRADPRPSKVGRIGHAAMGVRCLNVPSARLLSADRVPLRLPDHEIRTDVVLHPRGIRIMNADGSGNREFLGGGACNPAWSPDGTRIAYSTLFAADPARIRRGVFVINVDGSGDTRVLWNREDDFYGPTCSPDGSQIAYFFAFAFPASRQGLYVMNADGTVSTQLASDQPSGFFEPALSWTADGNRLAYEGASPGNAEIYVIDADGSGRRNLTNHSANDRHPSWSPAR